MNTGLSIRQITEEISSYKFSLSGTSVQFEWLISRCNQLAELLEKDGAAPDLIERIKAIAAHLAEQGREVTHELVRQQTLVFQQDAIVFHLMKQGYFKTLPV
jgi:hypothetical protein